jgi:OmcA/MtrC family decaheme c-type cytochrome
LNDAGLETDHGRYTEVKTCNQCHALNSYVSDQNAALAPFIHSIHMGLPSQANGGGAYQSGHDWTGAVEYGPVKFPQPEWHCNKCHADGTAVDKATADGKAGPVAAEADLAYSNPTRRACGSCHSDVNFETGENHTGGIQTSDSLCKACHPASGAITSVVYPVKTVHDLGPLGDDPSVQPEFSVSITLDTPARGYYIAGESPTVTVTLATIDGGPDVDYTAGPDTTAGDRNGVLTRANMWVYGPRSHAVPVLTPGSTTDSPTDPPTQGVSLLGHGDATGFHYTLQAIPDTLDAGTYLVRVGAADAGDVVSSTKPNPAPRTASTKVIHFQVGTATEEPKVSGNGCLNCHGNYAMHYEPGPYGTHNQPFDTDGCLGCHDYSGNHADYIGNRVHAIHHETFSGDANSGAANSRVWTEISFPQQANNCSICHTNSDAAVPVWESTEPLACGGCHGTNPDAVAAAKTYIADNGITGNEADEITTKAGNEAVAASHMLIMMGHSGGNQQDFITYGSEPVPGCLVCHGPGQPQDLYQLMGLAKFGIPSTSE